MSFDIVPFKKRVKRFFLQTTRAGKVDRLERLTKSLSQNTGLVKKKYDELHIVEGEVQTTLEKLRGEKFTGEMQVIDDLSLLTKKEKEKFKGALIEIKNKGIAELEPISETAQRIKAHMLITLNKAVVQRGVLIAKTKLASNASLQLDTLRIVETETRGVNEELRDLIQELDKLNEGAIDTFAVFQKDVKGVTQEDGNVIDTILNKLTGIESKGKSIYSKRKEQVEKKEEEANVAPVN